MSGGQDWAASVIRGESEPEHWFARAVSREFERAFGKNHWASDSQSTYSGSEATPIAEIAPVAVVRMSPGDVGIVVSSMSEPNRLSETQLTQIKNAASLFRVTGCTEYEFQAYDHVQLCLQHIAAIEAECERLIAVRNAADARVKQLDGELHDQKRLHEASSAVTAKVWQEHEQQFARQQCELAATKAEVERLRMVVKAAKHLLLAATGPNGGPTSWLETRDRWMACMDDGKEPDAAAGQECDE